MALLLSHAPTQIIWVWAVERHLQKISGVSCLLKSSKREAFMPRKDEYPVTIKVRFNFKVSNTQKACFAVHKMFYYFCFIVPFLLKKKKNICNNVSFLSPFKCEEKHDSFFSPPQPLHGLSFFRLFFIMGKNHAARETARILTYDCLVSTIKPKMFTTACNTVRKIDVKWFMSWSRKSFLKQKL